MLAGLTALVLAAAFSGAAYYVNEVEQPARLSLNDSSLLAQWKLSYARGYTMQASLAAVSGVFGLIAAWQTQHVLYLIGAVLILANWPYTLLIIKRVNDQLNAIDNAAANAASRALLVKWARLHAVRTGLGILATGVFMLALNRTL